MEITIYTNNTITIGNTAKPVGNINHTLCGYSTASKYQVLTVYSTGKKVKIHEPAYIGGGADWTINPKFESEVIKAVAQ